MKKANLKTLFLSSKLTEVKEKSQEINKRWNNFLQITKANQISTENGLNMIFFFFLSVGTFDNMD